MDIAQIIKYEGDNQTFIWKHPTEDFNTGTQLIVHESQEAIFFMNGQALDLFGAGRYTLETQNIPLVRKALNKTTNDQTPFHCEVYFINKTEQMGIKWGTDSKVNYLDPNYNGYAFPVGASGQMSLRVSDSRKLLVKVVGTVPSLSQMTLAAYFQAPMMMRIKSYLPNILVKHAIPIFDIDQHMEEFSADLHERLSVDFADYGVELSKFWINVLVKPENDPTYRKIMELRGRAQTDVAEARLQQQIDLIHQQTKAQKMVMESHAMAEKRKTEGYTYTQERSYDVAERVASNEGVGSFSNAGIGLGLMGGMAGGFGMAVANMTSDMISPIMTQGQSATQAQTVDMPSSLDSKEDQLSPKGAEQSGETTSIQNTKIADFQTKLQMLELMKGLISEEEYQAKVKELYDSIH